MTDDPNIGVNNADPVAGTGIPNVVDPVADPAATPTPSPAAEAGAQEGQPEPTGQVPYQAMKEERTARQAAQQENEILKAQLSNLKATVGNTVHYDAYGNPVQAQPAPNQAADVQKQLDELWETDPRKAMQTENMLMMNWYDNINQQVDAQEEAVATDHPDFNSYRGQVRKYIRQLPLGDRGKPGVVKLAYYAVRGQNVEGILKEKEQAMLNKIKAGQAATGLGAAGAVAASAIPSNVKLSEDQVKAATAMGVSPEDYAKNIREAKKS